MSTTDHSPSDSPSKWTWSKLLLALVLTIVCAIVVLTGITYVFFWVPGNSVEVRDRVKVAQLDAAVKKFSAKYGVLPPSMIKLCELRSAYGDSELDGDSVEILTRIFGPGIEPTWNSPGIDWNGDGIPGNVNGIMLYGDQCLVFFLGGIPNSRGPGAPHVGGFSEDHPTNPAQPGGNRIRFFDFSASRLVDYRGNGFYSYLNIYKRAPIAFLSSNKAYNSYEVCHCPGLNGVDVYPYQSEPDVFINPSSFQIISAGRDGVFGPGSTTSYVWNAKTCGSIAPAGRDDVANFSARTLSEGP